ncbi:zf-HC2 domain-containing protein [Granulicella sp. dw_53]|uniref:zf-HC2 domain-containing protein n=1 Tax=Granulicella sp. dw_53 TaxID=2719792 RepID=UPI001BD4A958
MPDKKQDLNQFGTAKPSQSGNPQHCAQCEAMLMDALDGTLSPADQSIFDLHLLSCVSCSEMMADAQRGTAWLEMLKYPRPEPSAALLDRILASTSGASASATKGNAHSPFLVPSNTLLSRPTVGIHLEAAASSSNVLPFRNRFAAILNLRALGHNLLQPRLAMTAAMAFFSVALTLNLTGLKLTQLRASDLRPSSLKRSLSEANAHVVRYYDNLRVVYELESRVHDLQRSSDVENSLPVAAPVQSAPDNPDAKPSGGNPNGQTGQPDQENQKRKPVPRPGTSRRESPAASPGDNSRYVVAGLVRRIPDLSPAPPLLQSLAILSPDTAPCITNDSQVKIKEGRLV